MKKFWAMALLLAAVAAGFQVLAAAGSLQAGVGKAEIVAPPRMPMAGYGDRMSKPSLGTHDQIYARALALEAGGTRVVFITGDVLNVWKDLRDEVLQRTAGLGYDYLSLNTTHTHNSMGGYQDDRMAEIAVMGKYHPEARKALVDALVAAAEQAVKGLQPASLAVGVKDCPAVGQNRRHEGGPIDPTIRVLGVWGKDGKLLAAIMNHGIHPTTMGGDNLLISGDNAGRAEWALEQKHPGAVALFMNSGLGDQGAGGKEMGRGWERVAGLGDSMAAAADEALASLHPSEQVEIRLYRRSFKMPEVQIRWAYECFGGLSPIMKQVGKGLTRSEGEVAAVSLNDAIIMLSSGEISLAMQQAIEKTAPPGKIPLVVAHANDWYGYVLTPEDYDTGGYESCMNLYGRDFGTQFIGEFQKMIEAGPVK